MKATAPPLRIFISGNSTEFKQLRQVATQTILSRGWVPVAQDHFATQQGALPEILKELVESCNAVICLVGQRFGHEPRMQGAGRRSYTQMEYDFARNHGLPVFIMMAEKGMVDVSSHEPSELAALQQAFIQEIADANLLRHTFRSEDELRLRILGIELPGSAGPEIQPDYRRKMLLSVSITALIAVGAFAVVLSWQQSEQSRDSKELKPTVIASSEADRNMELPASSDSPEQAQVTNTLGMVFLPLGSFFTGKKLLLSKWETRVKDWRAYASATGQSYTPTPGTQDLHPVSLITINSMVAFCDWLTAQETSAGRIPVGAAYRLPTLDEWQMAAGIIVGSKTPAYAWSQLPDPASPALANFSGSESATGNSRLPDDHHIKTSPVGIFLANKNGFFDLAGNIGEVCSVPNAKPVICGGDWQDMDFERMNLANSRMYDITDDVSEMVGFRCILEIH